MRDRGQCSAQQGLFDIKHQRYKIGHEEGSEQREDQENGVKQLTVTRVAPEHRADVAAVGGDGAARRLGRPVRRARHDVQQHGAVLRARRAPARALAATLGFGLVGVGGEGRRRHSGASGAMRNVLQRAGVQTKSCHVTDSDTN